MGNGHSARRGNRMQHGEEEYSIPRIIPSGHAGATRSGSLSSPPYSLSGDVPPFFLAPSYTAAVPSASSSHFYPSRHDVPNNGQYLISAPGGFRPLALPPTSIHAAGASHVPVIAEHQRANTIRNDVNLKKATLRLENDEANPGHQLVAFSFDSTLPGSICIFFLAKEGRNCSLTPIKPDSFKPVKVPFDKGLGQRFRQAVGTGINLSLVAEEDLQKEGEHEVYALVIRTETVPRDPPPDAPPRSNEPLGAPLPKWVHCQTTHAAIERRDGKYYVRVVKQTIWVEGVRYELQEIYGIESNASSGGFDGNDSGKECVICMSELRDTTLLPCRHMCMCSQCAKVLRFQTNRCPICRCPVERLLEIAVPKNQIDPLQEKSEFTNYGALQNGLVKAEIIDCRQ